MGQQPNVEITLRDLPPAQPGPDPARRWSPTRPGELSSPDDVPWGGAFGRPGPDSGFALTLAARMDLMLMPGERRADAEAAVAALAGARASLFGRAPTQEDAAIAATVLCYDPSGIPAAVSDRIAAERTGRVADMARKPKKASKLVDAVGAEVLVSDQRTVTSLVADGAVL